MADPLATLQIDPALVRDITEKVANAQIMAALGDPSRLIMNVVQQVMKEKVSDDGRVNRESSYYNKYDLIETLAANAIREKCNLVIREYIEANAEAIKKAFLAELEKPTMKKRLAIALITQCEENIRKFRFDFVLKPTEDR